MVYWGMDGVWIRGGGHKKAVEYAHHHSPGFEPGRETHTDDTITEQFAILVKILFGADSHCRFGDSRGETRHQVWFHACDDLPTLCTSTFSLNGGIVRQQQYRRMPLSQRLLF